MALELTLNYQKKIGLPGYSSHACSVSVNREILNLDEIGNVIPETYRMLQLAIDAELKQTGWLPGNGNGHPVSGNGANGNSRHAAAESDPAWNCSLKQRRLIEQVCKEQGILDTELEELAHARYGKAVYELNKLEASGLIDELLDTGPRSRNSRYFSNGNGRRLRAEPDGKEACP
jgi:hypothetical protein